MGQLISKQPSPSSQSSDVTHNVTEEQEKYAEMASAPQCLVDRRREDLSRPPWISCDVSAVPIMRVFSEFVIVLVLSDR